MPVNPAAALAIQVAKGILSMGWAFGSVDHVKQSHSGGPPPLTIKMSWPGVVNCQPECSQSGAIWDGLISRVFDVGRGMAENFSFSPCLLARRSCKAGL